MSGARGPTASELLVRRLETGRAQVVREVDTQQSTRTATWSRLAAAGTAAVARLDDEIVDGDDCIGIYGDSTLETVAAIAGCVATGRRFTILPPQSPGTSAATYGGHVASRLQLASVTKILAPPGSATWLSEMGHDVTSVDVDRDPSTEDLDSAVAAGRCDVRFVQFTSGSTMSPRAVEVGHGALVTNLQDVVVRRELDPATESFVSWLPMSHDMGLVGMVLLPLLFGGDLTISRPSLFIRSPDTWLSAIAAFGGTFTAAPSFAYGYCLRRGRGTWDSLSSLHTVVNAGERVDVRMAQEFASRCASSGLAADAMAACYGMAENAVAVTVPPRGSGLRTTSLPGGGARDDRSIEARHALLGTPLDRTSVEIDRGGASDGLVGADLGEVLVAGPSLARGYLGEDAPSFAAEDGWFRTGDLGVLVDGQLVVTGRLGDLINVRGRKLAAEDVEQVASVPGVRPGQVAAVGTSAYPLCVVVEVDDDASPSLDASIRTAVIEALGVRPEVFRVERSFLPRTTSGKLQRHRVRHWIESSGELDRS